MCVSGGGVPRSVYPSLALAPPYAENLQEVMHVISVSYVISGLSDGEGCQGDSSAPHCLVTEKAWPQWSLAQSFARPGQRVSGWHHGGNGQRWSRPCSLTASVPWVISVLTCNPLLPLLTAPLPPPSLLTPTPEVPSWTR